MKNPFKAFFKMVNNYVDLGKNAEDVRQTESGLLWLEFTRILHGNCPNCGQPMDDDRGTEVYCEHCKLERRRIY